MFSSTLFGPESLTPPTGFATVDASQVTMRQANPLMPARRTVRPLIHRAMEMVIIEKLAPTLSQAKKLAPTLGQVKIEQRLSLIAERLGRISEGIGQFADHRDLAVALAIVAIHACQDFSELSISIRWLGESTAKLGGVSVTDTAEVWDAVKQKQLKLMDQSIDELQSWTDRSSSETGERACVARICDCYVNRTERLDLAGLRLKTVPAMIGGFRWLKSVDLSNNELTALPETLGLLEDLETLTLQSAQLTDLPFSFDRLICLSSLNLRFNPIGTVPESIGRLSGLKVLDLGGTGLTVLPEFLSRLTNLRQLDVCCNQMIEVSPAIAGLPNLKTVYISSGNSQDLFPQSLRHEGKLVVCTGEIA